MPEPNDEQERPTRERRPEDTVLWVDQQIRAAIDRGDFDGLPYTGKPLPDRLTSQTDPDWWLKGLVEREKITGVLPEALQLRKDDTELDATLDRLARAADVRDALETFNQRIVEARRQLAGGPPVITPLRDVEAEVTAWHARRRARIAVAPVLPAATPRRRWWRRRSA